MSFTRLPLTGFTPVAPWSAVSPHLRLCVRAPASVSTLSPRLSALQFCLLTQQSPNDGPTAPPTPPPAQRGVHSGTRNTLHCSLALSLSLCTSENLYFRGCRHNGLIRKHRPLGSVFNPKGDQTREPLSVDALQLVQTLGLVLRSHRGQHSKRQRLMGCGPSVSRNLGRCRSSLRLV